MDNVALTHALYDAAQARDLTRFRAFFSDEAAVWQNFTGRELPIDQAVANLAGILAHVDQFRYEDRRYIAVPDGAIAQHVSHATLPGGKEMKIPMMMHLYMSGGRITRIEEYFDTGNAAGVAGG